MQGRRWNGSRIFSAIWRRWAEPGRRLETLKAADWLALRERLRTVLRASASVETPYLCILRKHVAAGNPELLHGISEAWKTLGPTNQPPKGPTK